jgi:glucose-6-phosphate dehydrogenase assembly protein OpcA
VIFTPTTYKVLGQSNPAATTATTLYTVPAATSTIVSTITVCNQAATAGSYRIAIRVAGATLAASQYIAYDVSLPANATDTLTLGVTLAATDVITVYGSSANFSFAAFGSELS